MYINICIYIYIHIHLHMYICMCHISYIQYAYTYVYHAYIPGHIRRAVRHALEPRNTILGGFRQSTNDVAIAVGIFAHYR